MKYCPICTTEYGPELDRCSADGARLLDRDQWAPGTVIRAKYRIVGTIGRGGMGIVYKAEHLVFKDLWALKVMSPRLSSEPEFVRRFYFEAEKQRRLKHRNVVRVDDVDQSEDGKLFIGMEFVDGMPLREMLRAAQGPLAVPLALSILRGVAEALEAADALGVVHRDIKPDNVLLERTPQGFIPKLTDFGVAKLREGTATVSKAPLLTPQYAAPEQWQPQLGSPDGRTDLYALGMTAYEMLAGSGPFQGSADHELMHAHLHQAPLPPSEHNPELAQWPGLDDLVLHLLEKDRERRPASARAWLDEMGRVELRTTHGAVTQPWREATVVPNATLVARPTPARLTPAPLTPAAAPARQPAPSVSDATPARHRGEARYTDAEPPAQARPPARGKLLLGVLAALGLAVLGAYYFLDSRNQLPAWAQWGTPAVAPAVTAPAASPSLPSTAAVVPAPAPAHAAAPLPQPVPAAAAPAPEPTPPPELKYALAPNGRLREADAVHGLAFLSNATLAVSTAEPALRFYELPDLGARVVNTTGDFRTLAFNRANGFLAGGSIEGTLQLWQSSGAPLPPIVNAQGGSIITAVAMNPAGTRLASGSADGAIRIWTINGQSVSRTAVNLQTGGEIRGLTFSGDGAQLAAAAGSQVLLYSTSSWNSSPLPGVRAQPWAVAFSPDHAWVAAGMADGAVALWRSSGSHSSKALSPGSGARINCLVFSHDSRSLVAGTGDGAVLRWSLDRTDAPERLPVHHTGNVFAVAFSPEGNWLATGGLDHMLQLLQPVAP